MGINVKTMTHDHRLTWMENKFVGLLWIDHVGRDNAISANELAVRFYYARDGVKIPEEDVDVMVFTLRCRPLRAYEQVKREIRTLQNHLLMEHSKIPVLSAAGDGGGYWIAESELEAEGFYHSFRQRGLTGVVKASRGKQAALVEMVQQLSFQFEELADKTGVPLSRPTVAMPTPIEVVDTFLARMLRNPEKFSDGLKKLGQKYGSVLLPKERVREMKQKAEELQRLVAGLEG